MLKEVPIFKKKKRVISWNLTLSLRLTKDKNCLKVVQSCLGVCKNTQIQRWKTSFGTSKKGFQVSCGNDMVFNSQTKWSYMAFRCLVITNTLVLNCSSVVAQLSDVCAGLTVRHPNWTHHCADCSQDCWVNTPISGVGLIHLNWTLEVV